MRPWPRRRSIRLMYGVQKTLPQPTTPRRMLTSRSKRSRGGRRLGGCSRSRSKGSRGAGGLGGCSRRAPRGLVVGVGPGRTIDVVAGRERQSGRERGGGGQGRGPRGAGG